MTAKREIPFGLGVLLSLASVIVLLVVNAAVSFWNLQVVTEGARWVAYTHEVMTGLDTLLSLAKDAETGQRGYLLTGDSAYLEPYNTAVSSISKQLEKLELLTGESPGSSARLGEIRGHLKAKLQELDETIVLRKNQGFEAARQVVQTDRGKEEMDALRAKVGGVIAHERDLLVRRERQTERAYSTAVVAGALTTLAGLAAIGMFVSLLSRSQRLQNRDAALIAEQQQLLHATLASIGDAVIATDSAGRVTFLNTIAQQLTGWTREESEGQPLDAVFRVVNEETREPVDNPALRALKEGTVLGLANHTALIAKDGSERPIDDSAAPIRDEGGKVIGTVLVFRDVNERRKAEHTLRQMAAELSHADRRKDEFLATLAHELRNPLAPIRNGLALMRLSRDNEADFEQILAMMERQSTQLMRLVDDLMDVSRIARGRLELRKEKILLADVIDSAVEASRQLVKEMRHELTVTLPADPVVIEGDRTRLAQVFMNLLMNAAKYTDMGGHIWIWSELQESVVLVTIKDTGIGIAAENLPRIFNMFAQVDRSLEKAQGGLGIGLTLVKQLVEMHRGTVEARSEGLGKGSEFKVCLPIDPSPVPQAPGSKVETATLKSAHRVLVVDDNQDLADTLTIMLRKMGNDARAAYDGEHGLEVAAEFHPEVVLLDIGLPKVNGYEVCRRIREMRTGNRIVVIAITGWAQEQDRRRSLEAGFDFHLIKPVDLQELQRLLAELQTGR